MNPMRLGITGPVQEMGSVNDLDNQTPSESILQVTTSSIKWDGSTTAQSAAVGVSGMVHTPRSGRGSPTVPPWQGLRWFSELLDGKVPAYGVTRCEPISGDRRSPGHAMRAAFDSTY
jgi:hypothetical protein